MPVDQQIAPLELHKPHYSPQKSLVLQEMRPCVQQSRLLHLDYFGLSVRNQTDLAIQLLIWLIHFDQVAAINLVQVCESVEHHHIKPMFGVGWEGLVSPLVMHDQFQAVALGASLHNQETQRRDQRIHGRNQ